MANIIIQVSKYLIIILMAAYTFSCFSIFTRSYEDEENKVLIRQDVLLFMIQITAFIAMYFATQDLRMMFIYGALAVIVMAVILLYNLIYPNVSRLVVNNMCMLITAGMIMITRLSAQSKSPYGIAIRQLVFVVVGIVFGLIVPVLIRKMTFLENWTYIYAAVGGAALLIVALFAATLGGAKLSFNIGPVSLQPSEFVKILFVFFVAASLNKSTEFKNVVVTTAIAAAHVLILVLSTDLGAALIFFIVYLIIWTVHYKFCPHDHKIYKISHQRDKENHEKVSDSSELFVPNAFSAVFAAAVPGHPRISVCFLLFSYRSFFPIHFLNPFLFVLLCLCYLHHILFVCHVHPDGIFLILHSNCSGGVFHSACCGFSVLRAASQSDALLLLLHLL